MKTFCFLVLTPTNFHKTFLVHNKEIKNEVWICFPSVKVLLEGIQIQKHFIWNYIENTWATRDFTKYKLYSLRGLVDPDLTNTWAAQTGEWQG